MADAGVCTGTLALLSSQQPRGSGTCRLQEEDPTSQHPLQLWSAMCLCSGLREWAGLCENVQAVSLRAGKGFR